MAICFPAAEISRTPLGRQLSRSWYFGEWRRNISVMCYDGSMGEVFCLGSVNQRLDIEEGFRAESGQDKEILGL
jgi:hypothetical protein